jgi:hypothetical protein
MIKILRNPNFSNWFDIRLFGELIDNAKSQAKALQIAKQIKRNNPHFQIITEEETNA